MLRFTLFGFPVAIHWMFWVVAAMLGGALSASGSMEMQAVLIRMAVIFVSILWHELGHAFAFRHYGQKSHIVLYGMGGYAQGTLPLNRRQDIVVSLAGPMAGFALGLVVWLLLRASPPLVIDKPMMGVLFGTLLFVNIIWSAINLLPVLPLDGGRVCAALVAGKGAGLAPKIGMVTAIATAVASIALNLFITAALFGFLAYQNWQMLQSIYGRSSGGGGGMFPPRPGAGRGF